MKTFNLNQEGFSLVETLVAITILLIIVVGPMTISTSTARSTSFSSEQVVAFFLAQEGLEIIQSSRDFWLLRSIDLLGDNDGSNDPDPGVAYFIFNAFLPSDCKSDNGCGLSMGEDGLSDGDDVTSECGGVNDVCRLYLSSDDGVRARYTHDSSGDVEETPFSRSIKYQQLSANEFKVISTVTWRTGNQRESQSVSVETHLFNVYDL